jgi:hypothetical protein
MNIDEDGTLIQTEEDRKELERRLFGDQADDNASADMTLQDCSENSAG